MLPNHLKSIEYKNIKFSKAKYNKGHRYVSLYYNKEAMTIHVPKMRLPFGLSQYNGKFSVDFSLDNLENNKEIGGFYNSMLEFERYIQEYAKENMKDWFESNNVDIVYKSCIMEKKPFSPLLKTKVMLDNVGKFKMSVYDENKQKVDEAILKKNIDTKGVIECSGIWISERDDVFSYGISWRVNQLKVYEYKEDVCFIEDSGGESEESEGELDFVDSD